MADAMMFTNDGETDYSYSLLFDWLLTHWTLGYLNDIFDEWFSKLILKFNGRDISYKSEILIGPNQC